MSYSDQTIFVTGGTGFVGSHIILQLLEAGHHVKATVRTGKATLLKSTYPSFNDRLEVIEIADILGCNLSDAFKAVHALIHVATPQFFTGDAEYVLKGATEGTEQILTQANDAGIKKIIITGSWASLFEPDLRKAFEPNLVDETWWSSVTMEEATSQKRDHFYAYMVGKPLSEKLAWSIAEQHPDIDLTTILPPIIYGPYVPHYPPAPGRSSLGTNEWIYHLITGSGPPSNAKTYPRMGTAHTVDVRDAAKAHVLALTAPPLLAENADGSKTTRRKRLITIGGTFTWPQAAEHLKVVRPDLKERLEKDESGPRRVSCCTVDTKLTEEVIGMRADEMIPWKKCVEDTVDCLLDWEKATSH